jgi:enamine deaminase RidA (YjgF/YER057c/UK114 family)
MKERRNPDTVHAPLGAYSHQVEATGERRLLAIAGQVGMRADGSLPDSPAEQLEVALANVHANLAAAGMRTGDLIKLTLFLTDEIPADERRTIVGRALGDVVPAMTLVYVARLGTPALKVEVEAFATAP